LAHNAAKERKFAIALSAFVSCSRDITILLKAVVKFDDVCCCVDPETEISPVLLAIVAMFVAFNDYKGRRGREEGEEGQKKRYKGQIRQQ